MEKRTLNSLKPFVLTVLSTLIFCSSCQSGEKADVSAAVETPETVSRTVDAFEMTLSSAKAKDGSIVELRLKPRIAVDSESIEVIFEGQNFPVFSIEDGTAFAAIVAVPFNSKPRQTKIDLLWKRDDDPTRREASIPLEVIDGNYRSETLKVQEDKVHPPKRVIKRIIREQKEIGKIYRNISRKRYWSGTFALPIESEVTSPFGNKRLYNGSMKNFHKGLDLRARTPTPIRAPEGAKVALAKDLYFTGKTVILDHGYGLYTIYGHMSKLQVKKGAIVTKGQVLGLSGATGRASGPHLHWGAVLMRLKFNPQDLTQVLR